MPRFTIVVPAYNAEATLGETLEAILAQTFDDWECMVVDDGSTDATHALADGFASHDARLRVLAQENRGTAGAYNTGVGAASGEYIVLCSADDLLLPNHLVEMARLIADEPWHEIYSCNGYLLYPDGERRLRYEDAEWQERRSLTFAQVAAGCFFSVGAVCHRDALLEAGGFRVGVFGEDYDLWLRMMASGSTHCYTPVAIAVHRVSESQKSSMRQRVLESDLEILEHLLACGELTESDARAVQAETAVRETRLVEARMGATLQQGSTRVAALLQRVFGVRLGAAVLQGMHRVSWVFRPLRVGLARRRARNGR